MQFKAERGKKKKLLIQSASLFEPHEWPFTPRDRFKFKILLLPTLLNSVKASLLIFILVPPQSHQPSTTWTQPQHSQRSMGIIYLLAKFHKHHAFPRKTSMEATVNWCLSSSNVPNKIHIRPQVAEETINLLLTEIPSAFKPVGSGNTHQEIDSQSKVCAYRKSRYPI